MFVAFFTQSNFFPKTIKPSPSLWHLKDKVNSQFSLCDTEHSVRALFPFIILMKIWPIFLGKNRCMQSVTHQLRHINKLVLAVIIHGQCCGWCWRLWGRNKRQVIDVLCQMLCEGDTQRQPSSYCYLKMSVCVWERGQEIIKTGVCLHMLMVCDYSLLAGLLLALCWEQVPESPWLSLI